MATQNQPSLIERAGRKIHYTFDTQGRIATIADAPGRSMTLRYDIAGRLIAVIDAQGYNVKATLDEEGRPVAIGLYEPDQKTPCAPLTAGLTSNIVSPAN